MSGSNYGFSIQKAQQIRDASTPMGGSIYSHGASLLPPLGGVYKTPKWEWTDLDICGSAEVGQFCHCFGLGYIAVIISTALTFVSVPLPAWLASNPRTGLGIRWGPETLGILAVSTASVPAVYPLATHV